MELLKNQVKELQLKVEAQKYQRSLGDDTAAAEGVGEQKAPENKYGANLKKWLQNLFII